MFCRKCGEALLNDDRFCPYCGAKVIERKREEELRIEEDVVYTGSNKNFFSETLKPNWNIEDFPNTEAAPKKTGDILVDWEKHKLLTPEVIDALTAKKEDFEQTDKDTLIFERVKPTYEIGEEKKLEDEKFYTFSQKNAEFQELLDKEYERIKASKESLAEQLEALESEEEIPQAWEDDEKILSTEIKESPSEVVIEKIIVSEDIPKELAGDKENEKQDIYISADSEEPVQTEGEGKSVQIKLGEMEVITKEPCSTKKTDEDDELEWKQQLPSFEDEKTEKKLSVFAIFLGVIVLVLGVSTLVLTIEQFTPQSAVGKAVHQILEKGRSFFSQEDASTMFVVAQGEEEHIQKTNQNIFTN